MASLETIEAELRATTQEMRSGFVGVNARLDKVNGRLDDHGKQIADTCTDVLLQDARIGSLQELASESRGAWRTLLVQVGGAVILYLLFQVMPKILVAAANAAQG